jgi:hypothetical protein
MQLNRYVIAILLSFLVYSLTGSISDVEAATGRCTSFQVSFNSDPASNNRSASQSDQFNISSSYAVTNIIPRLPQPGESISFSGTGEGAAAGFWARPVGSPPDDPCSFYVWSSNTGTFPNWKTGTLKRNDASGASCTRTLNFDQGVIFGANYTNSSGWSGSWCRNVDPTTTQGFLFNGATNTGGRCTNSCVIQAVPNFSRTYTLNAVPVCPAGTFLNTDVQAALAVWPGNNAQQLNWTYSPSGRTTRTMSMTSPFAGSRFYMILRTTSGTAFQPVGNVPHPGIVYQQNWNPQTWNATGSIGVVTNGTYTMNYQVPSQFCSAPTAPAITSVSCNANGQVTLNWRAAPGASGYAFRANNTYVPWDNCANTNGNFCNDAISGAQTSFTFNGSPGKTYKIWMHSLYGGTFGPSATTNVSCTIPAPTNFNATCKEGTATFTWSAPSGISQYYWRMSDLTSGQYYSNDSIGATSYTFNGAVPGRSYRAWIHSKRADISVLPNWSDAVYKEFSCPALPKCTIQGPATAIAGNPTAYAVQGQGATATQMFFAPKGTQMWTQFSGNATFPKAGQYDVVCNAQGLGGSCTGNPSRAGQADDCGASSRITVNVNAPTPTVTPTPAGYCTSNANCSAGNVCVNQGCVPPSPTPSPTQVPPTPTITPTSTPPATPTPNCYLRPKGDANCNNVIDSEDYTIWRAEFLGIIPQERADFSGKTECKDEEGNEKYVCQFDLEILFRSLIDGYDQNPPTPTPGLPTATPTPQVQPSQAVTITPVPTQSATATQIPTQAATQAPTQAPTNTTALPNCPSTCADSSVAACQGVDCNYCPPGQACTQVIRSCRSNSVQCKDTSGATRTCWTYTCVAGTSGTAQ